MTAVNSPLSPEKWAKIRDIYEKILDAPEDQRSTLAQNLCDGDSQIESEIQSLLSAHGNVGSFLYEPAAVALNCIPPSAGRELSSGTVLASRFHILRLLNTGGMGSVYEAWDSELREALALKTIRPEIASEPAVIERFKEEVRQARQITHPNICRVYDLFSHDFGPGDRIWFLTMQLLNGKTLLEHLRQEGPLTSKQALMLIREMISGLSAAHRHGIIHRDFKSANVMLVQETDQNIRAVITDFGLASQTTTAYRNTTSFARQGTLAYVAPEQWLDGVVAPAGDQYSLGIVICEMLTGERPIPAIHEDGSRSTAILSVGKSLHPRWEAAIRRCLETRPENRFKSLEDLLSAVDPSKRRKLILLGVAAGLAVVSLSVTGILVNKEVNQLPSLVELRQITTATDFSEGPKLSSDGKIIAYASDPAKSGNLDIWLKQLPDGVPKRITTDPAEDESPSLSSDGHLVAFESSRAHPGIYIADVNGGGERLLIPDGHEPAFSPRGRSILYWTGDEYGLQPSGKIFLFDLDTGKSIRLASGMKDARTPVWNSDGRHILFAGCANVNSPLPACTDWWVTSADGELPRETGAATVLRSQDVRPSGYFGGWQGDTVIFSAVHESSMRLWELELNGAKARIGGVAKQLISGDDHDFIIASSLVGSSLAICQWNPAVHIWRIDHAENARQAKVSRVTNDPEFDFSPSVSRNGRWLVFARGYSNGRKMYVADTRTGIEKLIPLDETSKIAPIINDSGTTIAYEATERGLPGIWVASTSGQARKFCTDCRNPTGWLGEPATLLYGNSALSEVRIGQVAVGRSRTILSLSDGMVQDAVWSPENHFILFTVLRPGLNGQIFAARFLPGTDAPDSHWIQITGASDSARKPRWSGDGKTIFFVSKRDGFWCLWGQHFDPALGRTTGEAFLVQDFHGERSLEGINASSLNVSVAGDSVYLNLLETDGTIWLGKLTSRSLFSRFK